MLACAYAGRRSSARTLQERRAVSTLCVSGWPYVRMSRGAKGVLGGPGPRRLPSLQTGSGPPGMRTTPRTAVTDLLCRKAGEGLRGLGRGPRIGPSVRGGALSSGLDPDRRCRRLVPGPRRCSELKGWSSSRLAVRGRLCLRLPAFRGPRCTYEVLCLLFWSWQTASGSSLPWRVSKDSRPTRAR